ncbi:type I restriction endonuclease subunit R [Corynebacterium hindlerae]|uniref:Type I restriction endonuclease subunit R n=1 Tax=Corynebacterium hindlerae TaxID=699041 RepID=A0A7G5FFY6_9CORY|nr:type I restriction endonuclease [Corynebacterium hindlerae]QMV85527.1 type I restriction endonuclease subunit R [Corynebacterium hindlerae]
MNHTLEHGFETAICQHLATSGWTYVDGARDTGFDPDLALFPGDVLDWLATQYPTEYAKVCPPDLGEVATKAAQHRLLIYLSKLLGKAPQKNHTKGGTIGGLLGVLRDGFSYMSAAHGKATFGPMAGFYPTNPLLTEVTERADANRLRVIRQVHFDTRPGNNETIDLVLLLNGIPVATLELKTDNTQTIEDAIRQYKKDRKPGKTRTLLQPGRCLVHFAVSNTEVQMATALAGDKTFFLPFNQGNGESAGNPPCADGSETSYLWRDVLAPRSLLQILSTYAMWQPSDKGGYLVFPRFHQRRAVENVIRDIEVAGVGQRYLIQHSAGSGKTKTIAWLAHRLARHFSGEIKTFDSIIIISDRQVLDRNLADEIKLLPASAGLVVNVDAKQGAKSPQLSKALREGGHIITCTLQTFPVVKQLLDSDSSLANRRWCVIVDEAHSSQSGSSSSALKELLAQVTGADVADLNEADDSDSPVEARLEETLAAHRSPVEQLIEAKLAAQDQAASAATNITFVAFTATPKPKTMRIFGTYDPETDTWNAFDHYTMAQAIQEGFILDVLTNYTTYSNYIRIADSMSRDEMVNKGEVVGEIVRYAREHPTNIAQKVAVVVNHYRDNVAGLLGGQARAMVVAATRESAFHWCNEMNKYIAKNNWQDEFKTLVAFSGSLDVPAPKKPVRTPEMTDEQFAQLVEDYELDLAQREGRATADGTYTEASFNGLSDTEGAYKDSDSPYRVLIVANKFQTGFNEPRLCAMYVDKKLSGVATVQTLSRLNRTFPGKTDPMVLDFVNDADSILADFQKFYTAATLFGDVEPSALFEVAERIDGAGFYTASDIEAVAVAATGDEVDHEVFRSTISPIVHRWNEGLRQARLSGDEDEVNRHKAFRSDLHTYVKSWEFLSQIVNFQDTTMRKRAILASYVLRNLRLGLSDVIDVSSVDIIGIAVAPKSVSENLGLTDGDGQLEVPTLGGGTAPADSSLGIAFTEAVDEANAILTAAGIPASNKAVRGFVMQVWGTLAPNQSVAKMAAENTASQLEHAPAFEQAVVGALIEVMNESREIQELFLSDDVSLKGLKKVLAGLAHNAVRQEESQR